MFLYKGNKLGYYTRVLKYGQIRCICAKLLLRYIILLFSLSQPALNPIDYGWCQVGDMYQIYWFDGQQAPALIEITACEPNSDIEEGKTLLVIYYKNINILRISLKLKVIPQPKDVYSVQHQL